MIIRNWREDLNLMFSMASGCDPNYKPPIDQPIEITRHFNVETIGGFEFSCEDNNSEFIEVGTYSCWGLEYSKLNEKEVRRLHSFLSQWLEKNQNDYF